MDIYVDEIILIWKTLARQSVKNIVVGGFASYFHVGSRITDDLDIWIKDSNKNRKKLVDAFE